VSKKGRDAKKGGGRRRPKAGSSDSKRTLATIAMKATSHPTRELILRELKEGPRSTLELEAATGEDRYNLYHHLGVLEDARLVTSSVGEGRTKTFELREAKRPEVAFLVLDRSDEEEAEILEKVVDLLERETPDGIPRASDVRRAKMVFYYSWSREG
jgi:DNA-binding transcriptional ArsR family regulator